MIRIDSKPAHAEAVSATPVAPKSDLMFPAPDLDGGAVRVWIVGEQRAAVRLRETLRRMPGAWEIVAAAGIEPPVKPLSNASTAVESWRAEDFQRVMLALCVDEVHVALPPRESRYYLKRLKSAAREIGIPVAVHHWVVDPEKAAAGQPGERGVVEYFNRHSSAVGIPSKVKRALDVVIASLALLLALPLLCVISLAVKLTSPGPVLFRQARIGRKRRQFRMLKFRTMVQNAEDLRPVVQPLNNARGISFKVISDPRLTRIGSFLRRSSLDELPQLLNVLRGDMSLVGPRPIPVWVAEQLEKANYFRRFCMLPGITGLWQVEGRVQDFDRMALLDLHYVDHWTPGLDLKLLARTIPAVIRAEGAH